MTEKSSDDHTAEIFRVRAGIVIEAAPEDIFHYVSDLSRSGEWSPECLGGTWRVGGPDRVGSVFEGRNHRAADVVGWAPVVRGTWTTEAEVVEVDPPRRFAWAMRDSAGRRQDSVWSFEVRPVPDGGELVHAFRMGRPTEGIRKIVSGLSPEQAEAFFRDWSVKLAGDLRTTLANIREVLGKRAGESIRGNS
ncbi:SRPBCC family protein [Saccharothrix sp. NPDC042600]|uniref:SRPBCC family protein n=1 Tax=Saccharothrix TaxID=2071 RepID=UPI0033D5B29A